MSQITNSVEVNDAQMQKYSDLIYSKTGIRIPVQKKTLMSNRIRRRLRETGISDYEQYFQLLNKLSMKDKEWDHFLQEVTTHETYMFRDATQWDWFSKVYLSDLRKAADAGQPRSLRVWSAACSTGDEAYTIATCIANSILDLPQWKINNVGTDIGIGAVEAAKAALFNERAINLVPDALKKKFFGKLPDTELWQPRVELKQMTSFRQHNLMQPLAEKPFDVIFLKNVLIYFDAVSKATVVANVKKLLRPGGYLVAGAAEGVGDHLRDMKRVQAWLFQAPND
jgi:chemotaxis protein methyltransferase CheR